VDIVNLGAQAVPLYPKYITNTNKVIPVILYCLTSGSMNFGFKN